MYISCQMQSVRCCYFCKITSLHFPSASLMIQPDFTNFCLCTCLLWLVISVGEELTKIFLSLLHLLRCHMQLSHTQTRESYSRSRTLYISTSFGIKVVSKDTGRECAKAAAVRIIKNKTLYASWQPRIHTEWPLRPEKSKLACLKPEI